MVKCTELDVQINTSKTTVQLNNLEVEKRTELLQQSVNETQMFYQRENNFVLKKVVANIDRVCRHVEWYLSLISVVFPMSNLIIIKGNEVYVNVTVQILTWLVQKLPEDSNIYKISTLIDFFLRGTSPIWPHHKWLSMGNKLFLIDTEAVWIAFDCLLNRNRDDTIVNSDFLPRNANESVASGEPFIEDAR